MMHKPFKYITAVLAASAVLMADPSQSYAAPMIVDPGQGLVVLTVSDPAADELSGITHAGGSAYWAVGDSVSKLFSLNIDINSTDGTITSAEVLSAANTVTLTDSVGGALPDGDREGVVLVGSSVLIADEIGPSIHTHSLATGNRSDQITTASDAQLGVFTNIRSGFSWESLARQSDGSATWTANEEALTVDGDTATSVAGSVVRIQKFDSSLTPAGQWAYVTAPVTGGTGHSGERSGLVDMLVLDDGTLLTMERSVAVMNTFLGAIPVNFDIRIYAVDFTSATDVSAAPFDDGLIGESFTPAAKTLLWSGLFGPTTGANFEGITLGPTLDDGSRSIILVSDNQGQSLIPQYVYALKLVPEPATLSMLALPLLLIARSRHD